MAKLLLGNSAAAVIRDRMPDRTVWHHPIDAGRKPATFASMDRVVSFMLLLALAGCNASPTKVEAGTNNAAMSAGGNGNDVTEVPDDSATATENSDRADRDKLVSDAIGNSSNTSVVDPD